MVIATAYLGPESWFKAYIQPDTVIEVMESFEKQTFRNRCRILSPGGEEVLLTVPVKKVESKQLTRDIEISYQQKWQHQHWIALTSAYKHTPYFDYFAEYLHPWYENTTKWLVDLNEGLAEVIIPLLQHSCPTETAARHVPRTSDWQQIIYNDQHPWQNEISIVDKLFKQ